MEYCVLQKIRENHAKGQIHNRLINCITFYCSDGEAYLPSFFLSYHAEDSWLIKNISANNTISIDKKQCVVQPVIDALMGNPVNLPQESVNLIHQWNIPVYISLGDVFVGVPETKINNKRTIKECRFNAYAKYTAEGSRLIEAAEEAGVQSSNLRVIFAVGDIILNKTNIKSASSKYGTTQRLIQHQLDKYHMLEDLRTRSDANTKLAAQQGEMHRMARVRNKKRKNYNESDTEQTNCESEIVPKETKRKHYDEYDIDQIDCDANDNKGVKTDSQYVNESYIHRTNPEKHEAVKVTIKIRNNNKVNNSTFEESSGGSTASVSNPNLNKKLEKEHVAESELTTPEGVLDENVLLSRATKLETELNNKPTTDTESPKLIAMRKIRDEKEEEQIRADFVDTDEQEREPYQVKASPISDNGNDFDETSASNENYEVMEEAKVFKCTDELEVPNETINETQVELKEEDKQEMMSSNNQEVAPEVSNIQPITEDFLIQACQDKNISEQVLDEYLNENKDFETEADFRNWADIDKVTQMLGDPIFSNCLEFGQY